MTPEEMKKRTKAFALRVLRVVGTLPSGRVEDVIARQLTKSGTSVGANYRAACRSRTDKDFLARMGVVEEEADESIYWMELLVESEIVKAQRLAELMREGEEILKIVVASITTVKARTRKPGGRKSEIRNSKSEMCS